MRRVISYIIAIVISTSCFGSDIPESKSADEIRDAISKYICFNIYWGGGAQFYKRGKSAKVTWSIADNTVSAKSTELMTTGGPKPEAMEVIYVGNISTNGVVIYTHEARPLSLLPMATTERSGTQSKFGSFSIQVPYECDQNIDKATPEKDALLDNLRGVLVDDLESYNKHGKHYDHNLAVRVVNFNLGYPYTYIYIPRTDEIYSINLPHGSSAKLTDGSLDYRGKGSQQQEFLKKILANSFSLQLTLSPPNS